MIPGVCLKTYEFPHVATRNVSLKINGVKKKVLRQENNKQILKISNFEQGEKYDCNENS